RSTRNRESVHAKFSLFPSFFLLLLTLFPSPFSPTRAQPSYFYPQSANPAQARRDISTPCGLNRFMSVLESLILPCDSTGKGTALQAPRSGRQRSARNLYINKSKQHGQSSARDPPGGGGRGGGSVGVHGAGAAGAAERDGRAGAIAPQATPPQHTNQTPTPSPSSLSHTRINLTPFFPLLPPQQHQPEMNPPPPPSCTNPSNQTGRRTNPPSPHPTTLQPRHSLLPSLNRQPKQPKKLASPPPLSPTTAPTPPTQEQLRLLTPNQRQNNP
ncbi:hypothetical protein C7M84_008769, partial [Penaeus vannamei]